MKLTHPTWFHTFLKSQICSCSTHHWDRCHVRPSCFSKGCKRREKCVHGSKMLLTLHPIRVRLLPFPFYIHNDHFPVWNLEWCGGVVSEIYLFFAAMSNVTINCRYVVPKLLSDFTLHFNVSRFDIMREPSQCGLGDNIVWGFQVQSNSKTLQKLKRTHQTSLV